MYIYILIKIDRTYLTVAENTYKLISEDLLTVNVDTSNFGYLPFLQDLSLKFSVDSVKYVRKTRKRERERKVGKDEISYMIQIL